jgi:hypothetical protein
VHGLVEATVARELGDAEREPRVRDELPVRLVREPLLGEHALETALEPVAVACDELGAGDSLRRVFGMEVEREPVDSGVELAP